MTRSGRVLVCRGPVCAGQRGADRVHDRLVAALDERDLASRVTVGRQNCFGRCSRGPNVYVRVPTGDDNERVVSSLYNWVGIDDIDADVDAIVSEHIARGHIARHLIERAASKRASDLRDPESK